MPLFGVLMLVSYPSLSGYALLDTLQSRLTTDQLPRLHADNSKLKRQWV